MIVNERLCEVCQKQFWGDAIKWEHSYEFPKYIEIKCLRKLLKEQTIFKLVKKDD